jgi:hypothetical protein
MMKKIHLRFTDRALRRMMEPYPALDPSLSQAAIRYLRRLFKALRTYW